MREVARHTQKLAVPLLWGLLETSLVHIGAMYSHFKLLTNFPMRFYIYIYSQNDHINFVSTKFIWMFLIDDLLVML